MNNETMPYVIAKKKYTRFYGSDAKNFKYACAVSTLPGGFSTFFLGFDSKEEMKNAIGDIVVKTRSGFRDSTNKFVDTYNEEKKGVAKLLSHRFGKKDSTL